MTGASALGSPVLMGVGYGQKVKTETDTPCLERVEGRTGSFTSIFLEKCHGIWTCVIIARKKRTTHGAKCHFAKATEADVLKIRADYMAGKSMSALGREFKLNSATVFAITHNETWKNLPLTSSFPRSDKCKDIDFAKGCRMLLNREQVVEVLKHPSSNRSKIAREFGVSVGVIVKIFEKPEYYLTYAKPAESTA